VILTVHVTPGAKEERVGPWLDETTVKIRVRAKAEGGKANEAVIKALATICNCAPSHISIVRGATTRMKQIEIPDVYTNLLASKREGNTLNPSS
jgi:uncharacterized protein (TIGR00251 family)